MNFEEFQKIYHQCFEEIWQFFTPEMQKKLAKHYSHWGNEHFNFHNHFSRSDWRFFQCYKHLFADDKTPKEKIKYLDIGGFWGILPMVLKRSGYPNVKITEKLEYYDSAFDPLFDFLRENGIEIVDIDPIAEKLDVGKFTHISCLALIEHLPHSPKKLMENINNSLQEKGRLFIEVPNIAYWPNRINLLTKGKTPLPHIEDIYNSAIPYIGHHHEYTLPELEWLIENSGLKNLHTHTFNYSLPPKFKPTDPYCLKFFPCYLFKNCRETLSALAEKP